MRATFDYVVRSRTTRLSLLPTELLDPLYRFWILQPRILSLDVTSAYCVFEGRTWYLLFEPPPIEMEDWRNVVYTRVRGMGDLPRATTTHRCIEQNLLFDLASHMAEVTPELVIPRFRYRYSVAVEIGDEVKVGELTLRCVDASLDPVGVRTLIRPDPRSCCVLV